MSAPAPAAAWVEGLAAGLGSRDAAEAFAARVPAGYEQQVDPAQAAADAANLAALGASDAGPPGSQRFAVGVSTAADRTAPSLRLRRYGLAGVELSGFLPVLESFGLVVVEAVPMAVAAGGGAPAAHIDDFGLRSSAAAAPADLLADPTAGVRLVEAIEAVTTGAADLDSLNRLVLAAGLDWVQVRLLRAYRRYRRQAGTGFGDAALDDPLAAYPAVARGLVDLVEARFDPGLDDGSRPAAVEAVRASLLERVGEVTHLEQDQVLRGYLALVDATLRTSYFLRRPDGGIPATLTLKLDSRGVPGLPLPRPQVEAWVHGSAVDGIHLRFGPIARGGLRWSDRPEDFRTEILDLAAAQVKKNAVIVPTGAKGGFVCRQHGPTTPEVVRSAYQAFVSGLLDITDNVVDGRAVTPPGVVARDGEDPYLVVAADRGTATFSDTANAISEARGFWLGDAFASGGSHGYDHKAMGITARGAWVAVRRHFHQLGIDVQTETVKVAGVGDMSGDVFGNGMLRSRALALVAAFDHRHIFLDPDPDPEASFVERSRMAGLARSSWDDYDRSVLSEGGGIWPRDAKVVPISPAARRVLGVTDEELSPPGLISAILASPVDLLWFGGIGTYLKAPGEADTEVGDHANDAVRVTSDQVRARVVAEGGNLAVTQPGRIRYSRRGGRINTDFIDNAAGVATSDREVNLKILIDLAIERGRLAADRRDEVLAAAEPQVAAEVLKQVDHSVAALTRAVPASARELDAYESLIADLEGAGLLDREVEDLPGIEELARRREAGAGLIRPELAVLLSYAKSHLMDTVERSALPADAYLRDAVRPYFPAEVRAGIDDLIPEHRLYPQLVATDVAGEMVDQLGPVWGHETAAELGVELADVAAAFWTAREVLDAGDLLARVEAAGTSLTADADADLHDAVASAVAHLARRYLLTGRYLPAEVIVHDAAVAAALRADPSRERSVVATLSDHEIPADLLADVADCQALVDLADAQVAAGQAGAGAAAAVEALAALDRVAGTERLARSIARIEPPGRWVGWQLRALIDDVAAWRTAAAAAALAGSGAGVAAAVGAWVAERSAAFERLRLLLDQLEARLGGGGAPSDRSVAEQMALAATLVRRLPR